MKCIFLSANLIFGDMHCDSMTKLEIDSASTGSAYWGPSNYFDFNGSASLNP